MMEDIFADIVFYNGSVITVNQNNDIVQAAAVKGKHILYVGSDEEINEYIGKETHIVDLRGRTLMPGFVEAHSHFMLRSLYENEILIRTDYTRVKSIEQLKEVIRKETEKKRLGDWIVVQGYDHNKLLERRHPTYADLDEAAPNHPVWCIRADYHMGVCNTMALKLAGITVESAKQFLPGEIVLDQSGKLTGLVKEDGFGYLNSFVTYDDERLLEAYKLCDKAFIKVGITSVHDAGAYGCQFIKVLQDAVFARDVHVRIYEMVYRMLGKQSIRDFIYEHIKTGLHTNMGDEHFKLGPAKLLLDGSSSGPSCYTREPYSHDPDLKGIMNLTQEEMDQVMLDAHKAGFQLTAHAVGDGAVEMMLNSIEKALKAYPKADCRPRIEHCAIIDDRLLQKIKELDVIPVSNPGLLAFNAKDYNRYYGDRVNHLFSHKSYVENGIIFAAGADAPCMDENPLLGIWGAVARKDMINGESCGDCQKIGVMEAIRMFTYNGAYASFDEKIKGSLEVNKLADMIVLSENIMESTPDHIKDIQVDMTFIDGKMLYNALD